MQNRNRPRPQCGFDDLVDSDRVRTMLAQGDGQGVKIAVLDTGVEVAHPALEGCVKASYEVVRLGAQLVCREGAGEDLVGHGTACAGIIHQHAPHAEIHSVRVIGRNAQGTGEQFLCGLAWAIDNRMDVVNLSLGTTQRRFQAALHDLADRAYFAGVILVAAANNYQGPSYPANFASLIAVDNQSFPEPFTFNYHLGRPIEMEGHGVYVKAPTLGGEYQLWTGTSFACPHVTAAVARLRSMAPTLTAFQAKALLWSIRANREPAAELSPSEDGGANAT